MHFEKLKLVQRGGITVGKGGEAAVVQLFFRPQRTEFTKGVAYGKENPG